MKVCPFCDEENEDIAIKCTVCGTQFSETENDSPLETNASTALSVIDSAPLTDSSAGGYAVVLSSAGKNKIAVIKEIKEHFGCGLAEAKQKSESALVAKGMSREDADMLASKLQSVGAIVEVTEDENAQEDNTQSKASNRSTEAKVSKDLVIGLVIGITVLVGIILVLLIS